MRMDRTTAAVAVLLALYAAVLTAACVYGAITS